MASAVVMCNGSVGTLLACAAAGLRAATGSPPVKTLAFIYGRTEFHLQAAAAHAAEFGIPVLPERQPIVSADTVTGWIPVLLEASLESRKLGGGDVVWPIAFQDREGDLDVWGTSTAMSAALLVSQLASLSLTPDSAPPMVTVRAPYADLSERQLADLVLDMDLPIWKCWWMAAAKLGTGEIQAQAQAEQQRWKALLKQAGWAGSLEARAEVVVRPDPLGPPPKPSHRGNKE